MLSQHPSQFPQHSSPTCRHQLRCMKAVPVSAQHHPGGGSVTLLSRVPWALCSAGFRWAPSPEPPYFCSLPGLMAQEDAQVMAPTRVPWSEAVRKALSQKPNPKSDNAPKVAKKVPTSCLSQEARILFHLREALSTSKLCMCTRRSH